MNFLKPKTQQVNTTLTKEECINEIKKKIESNEFTLEQLNRFVRLINDKERLKLALFFL